MSSGSGVSTATPAGWALFAGCPHPTAPLGRRMGRWAPRWAARGASRRAPAWTFQCWFRACRAAAVHHGARWRALAHASSRKNVRVPRLTRPPTSTPKARGRGWPSRRTGLTIVASTAIWAPCQMGSPLATTSMRRPSPAGTSAEGDVRCDSPLCRCVLLLAQLEIYFSFFLGPFFGCLGCLSSRG